MNGGKSSVLTLADWMIKPISVRARDIPYTNLKLHQLVLGNNSSLDYAACRCAGHLPAYCCTWAEVGTQHNSHKMLNLWCWIYFIKIYNPGWRIAACGDIVDEALIDETLKGLDTLKGIHFHQGASRAGQICMPVRWAKLADRLYPMWATSTKYRVRAGAGRAKIFSARR